MWLRITGKENFMLSKVKPTISYGDIAITSQATHTTNIHRETPKSLDYHLKFHN